MGMPWPIEVEDAKLWREKNLTLIGDKTGPKNKDLDIDDDDLSLESLHFELPEGVEVENVLERIQTQERTLFGKIQAVEKALQEKAEPKLAGKLERLRRDYRDCSKLVIAVSRAIQDLRTKRGQLISAEVAGKFVSLQLDPIAQVVRSIPQKMGKNDGGSNL